VLFSQVLCQIGRANCILVSFENSFFEANVAKHLVFANSFFRRIDSVPKILPDKALSFPVFLQLHAQISQPVAITVIFSTLVVNYRLTKRSNRPTSGHINQVKQQ